MDRDIGSDDQRDPGPEREDRRNQPIDLARAGNNPSARILPTTKRRGTPEPATRSAIESRTTGRANPRSRSN